MEYMAIAQPETAHLTPIVIVGGAFQNFNSYKYCVEQLFRAGPIILIDMPSMGANQQMSNVETGESAGTLELHDLGQMLGNWLDIVGLDKVSVMGMSLGSVVASCLAEELNNVSRACKVMGVSR